MKTEKYILYDTKNIQDHNRIYILKSWIMEELLMVGLLGILFCFETESRARWILFGCGVGALIYLNLIKWLRGRIGLPGNLVIVAGIAAVIYDVGNAGRGLLYFMNQWITMWDNQFDRRVDRFQIGNVTWFGRIQILLLLLFVMSVLIERWVTAGRVTAIGIMVIGLIIAGSLFGLNYQIWYVGALIAGWLLCWLIALAGDRKQNVRLVLCLCLAGMLAGGAFGLVHYSGSRYVAQIKNDMIDAIREVRYGTDLLPQGDMTVADTMEGDEGEEVLHLTFTRPQKMYLKGFVGSVFDESRWTTIPYTSYSDEETMMMHWVDSQQQKVSYQYADFHEYASVGAKTKMDDVTVENLGADRRYVYLPYTTDTLLSGAAYENRDYQMKSKGIFGERTYTFRTIYEDIDTDLLVDSTVDMEKSGAAEYAQWEQVYQSFVKAKYLAIDEEEQTQIQELFFHEVDASDWSINQVTSQIRTILQSQATYREKPQAYDGNQDFVSWFIDEHMEGNSSYFATIAALAFRTAGIPARYVEGYYLDVTSAYALDAEDATETTLTGENAHAWVEVYTDTVGWIPIEVTPGFYYVEYTTQEVKDAPQSSVNIKNETDEAQLSGSTTDRIDSSTDTEQEPEEPPVVETVIYTLGIVVFLVMIVWLLQVIMSLRYQIMRMRYHRRLERVDSQMGSKILYHHVYCVLRLEEPQLCEDFPYENISWILEHHPTIQRFECERFVELLQKVVFGEQELTPAEYMTVQRFDERISTEVYGTLGVWKRFVGQYLRVLF